MPEAPEVDRDCSRPPRRTTRRHPSSIWNDDDQRRVLPSTNSLSREGGRSCGSGAAAVSAVRRRTVGTLPLRLAGRLDRRDDPNHRRANAVRRRTRASRARNRNRRRPRGCGAATARPPPPIPAPPQPEARFIVTDAKQHTNLASLRSRAGGSHVALAVLLARAGVLDEAQPQTIAGERRQSRFVCRQALAGTAERHSLARPPSAIRVATKPSSVDRFVTRYG